MKTGLLGPCCVVAKMRDVIKKEFPEAEIVELIYESYKETPDLVQKYQKQVDAFLFGGKTPFKLTESRVKEEVPWAFIPRQGSSLLRALLEASYMRKLDITKISLDTYSKDMLLEAYGEIGVSEQGLVNFIAEQRLNQMDYYDYLLDFHHTNYKKNHVSCCITGITEIFDSLNQEGIPCVRTIATASTILLTYNRLELKYLAQTNQNSNIVVIAVRIDLPSYYSVESSDEHIYLINKNKVLEKIYLFASSIEAAVAESTDREFLMFTTKKILESETNGLQDIYLLDLLKDTIATNVNIGIGYGETAKEAKYNAYKGVDKAVKNGGNVAFAVYSGGNVRGPFRFTKKKENIIDKDLLKISKETGISNNTLFKIYKTVARSNERDFTSKELALACDMSKRNMDRLITKLEVSGYCHVAGEIIVNNAGRPSRVIRITGF